MTSTALPTVKDQVLASYGLIESASVRSITDFNPSKLKGNEVNANYGQKTEDFINTFICHLIFYAFFCVTCVIHILLDLGLGAFIKDRFSRFIGLGKQTFFSKRPAFA